MSTDLFSYTTLTGDPRLPIVIFIHGYCQNGKETWSETVEALRRLNTPNTMVVITRQHGDYAGRKTLGEQLQELRDYIAELRDRGVLTNRAIWVGHSLGGLLADDMAYTFPTITRGVITLAQTSTHGGWMLFNPSFWLNGGFISLPATIKSVLTGRSVRFPMGMARGLFADPDCPQERFQRFFQAQQPDSAWLFIEYLFTYVMPWGTLRRLRALGRAQHKLMIGFTKDTLISPASLRWLAWRTHTELAWINSAHCWWLGSGIELVAHDLKKAIQRMGE